jgi:alpha-D-ribose 1-methylphosphonate 5-triphosphate synthase subunit PhnH
VKTFDPVFGSQRVFRCLLEATASPGKVFALPPFDAAAPETVARTLLDPEVTFCVAGREARETEGRLSRLTGARAVPPPEADFALMLDAEAGGLASELERGSLEYPERGATVIYAVVRLAETGSLALRLGGPGVPESRNLGVEGLLISEAEALQEGRAGYPLGVEAYLVDEAGMVAGLPRSTSLEVIS